ncbi:hypothetical protein PP182_02495 [Maribacter sp. PR1]|uniref:Lipocalin-like domain-containing protein n=1 Tax=Maribacter cobaltidurans TaxID=1178778 RepID=A0ABU7IPP6_9FLAO|nr:MULTISPECIES: hypothetical protein [Maribacter]MDC6387535.1 hypothetical protein [Maribacter sp. PR1]MEE1974922.1 hypothetical protein [Maribacter cobaltidurans]
MKISKSLIYLFVTVLTFSLSSCSNDSDDDSMEEATELIIGEWLFASQNDYRCGTDEVVTDRPASDNEYDQTLVFNSDMTYLRYRDGELVDFEDQMGTWENIGDGFYRLNYTVEGEPDSYSLEVEFIGNNTMNFGIDDPCVEISTKGNIYTYSVYNRQ